VAVLKVKLTGHAVEWTTGDLDSVGVHDLGRISTSFSYRGSLTRMRQTGHHIYGATP